LGLGESSFATTLLTLSLWRCFTWGATSLQEREQKNHYSKTIKNVKHRRSTSNENVTHAKNIRHETNKPTKRQCNFWMNVFWMDGNTEK
jgi:hypothetical protein